VKALTVRLPVDLHDDLTLVAEVDGMSVADVVRMALDQYIDKRREQPDFKTAAHNQVMRFRRMMEPTDAQ
jgi:predicted transcriptional regulator